MRLLQRINRSPAEGGSYSAAAGTVVKSCLLRAARRAARTDSSGPPVLAICVIRLDGAKVIRAVVMNPRLWDATGLTASWAVQWLPSRPIGHGRAPQRLSSASGSCCESPAC